MATKIGINGFGRIGRAVFKILKEKYPHLPVAGINNLSPIENAAYLLKHDSMYRTYDKEVKYTAKHLIVDGEKIPVSAERDPEKLPWKELGVSIVLECTGVFRTGELAAKHLKAGAKKVIISAPAKSDDVPTYVLGVNHKKLKKSENIISNASCTTNCIAPITKVIKDKIGIKKVMMTTIHSYTANQNLVDGVNKDFRRGRAAAQNIVPTTTGAAIATTKTIPELAGKFDGISVRVPTPVVSFSDFVFSLKRKVTKEEVNKILKQASRTANYKGILAVTEEPLTSTDFIGNSHSAIVDLSLTKVVDGDLLKIVAWYDNEWGYSNRLADLTALLAKML